LTYLEVNDYKDDDHSGEEVRKIRRILSVESILKRVELVALGQQEVEKSNDCALKLGALLGSDGDGGEAAPENVLADIRGDEERYARAETVALLEELVEENHDHARGEQLNDNQDGVEGTEVREVTVHAREEISESLTEGDDETEKLLDGLEKVTILL